MKKAAFLLLASTVVSGFSQTKSTGTIPLLSNTTAKLDLNQSNTTATLTLTGPSDRWFALQFGSFVNGDGMVSGKDMVYWDGTAIVDCIHNGVNITPTSDAIANWVTVSVTPNSPSNGLITAVATRSFVGDATDYTFNFADSTIDFAFAKRSTAGFLLNYHGATNSGYAINTAFITLGVEDLSLKASTVFPNPSNGRFTVKTKTTLEKINVYSQTGAFVKTINGIEGTNEAEVNIEGLSTGVYLLELQNATEKSWKKVVIQ